MTIEWLLGASRSLDEAYEFLETMNPAAATKLYNSIMDDVQRLATMPLMAPVEPWLDKAPQMFRSLVSCKRYKVVYYIEDNTVFIADVWDCRQSPESIKERVAEATEV
jgi:plasmid stabilization system protein ParE